MNEMNTTTAESAAAGEPMGTEGLASRGHASVSDYFGALAIHAPVLEGLVRGLRGADLARQPAVDDLDGLDGMDQPELPRMVEVTADGIAVLTIYGIVAKHSGLFGGASSVVVRRELRKMSNDPRIRGIIIQVDSPGGTVSGTEALASDIHEASKRKLTVTTFRDIGASAAYYFGSQASRVVAQPASLVGSIGIYSVLTDSSKGASDAGIKVHIVRPSGGGDFKGMGVPGTEITPAHLAEAQRIVTGFHNAFIDAVARGRKLPHAYVSTLADGRVHPARDAVGLKLVDAVETFDATLAWVREQIGATSANPGVKPVKAAVPTPEPVAVAPEPPRAATFTELKAALPAASDEFILEYIDVGDTIDAAKDAYCDLLEREIAKAEASKAEANRAVSGKRSGVPVLTERPRRAVPDIGGGAKAAFEEIVQERMVETKEPRHQAWAWACRNHHDLREAMVAQVNMGRMMND